MLSFAGPARAVYESGCTGFFPARALSAPGLEVVPVATSSLPASPDSRSRKSDRRDAERLARLALAGGLSEVWVPSPEVEGLRDLSRALDDAASEREAARLRVSSLLLRHGEVWDERSPSGRRRKAWGSAHWAWLESRELPDPASRAALAFALGRAREAERACAELAEQACALARSCPLAPQIAALQRVRGCGFVTALAFCASVGDFERFGGGRKVTSYFGLAPRESSSGGRRALGSVGRDGCDLVRRLLVECAWHYLRPARGSGAKAGPAVPPAVARAAAGASRRLAERRGRLLGAGLHPNKANTATAAEMSRALWAVGREAQRAAS